MSTKKITSLIILIILVLLIVFGIFYILDKRQEGRVTEDQQTDNGLPMDGSSGNNGFENNQETGDRNIILSPGEIFDINGDVVRKVDSRLRQITTEPVSGGSIDQEIVLIEEIVISEDSEDEIIEKEEIAYLTYFIQKSNGHVLKDSDHEVGLVKILNKTIPQTEVGIITKDFSIIQYLDSTKEVIKSFSGTFDLEKTTEVGDEGNDIEKENIIFNGIILPNNLESPTLSPDKTKVAFLSRDESITNILIIDTDNFNNMSIIYSTTLIDIFLEWGSDDYLYITSKADSRAEGFVRRINPTTGSEQTILSGIYGLTSKVSSDSDNILLSNSLNEDSSLLLYNTNNDIYSTLGIYTLPEKCVWSKIEPSIAYCAGQSFRPNGKLPQDWYQNKISFVDILWKIDTEEQSTKELYTFPDIDRIFDITNPQLSPDEKRLLFIDKNDATPWVLNLQNLPN